MLAPTTEIVKRSTTQLPLCADVSRSNLHSEKRVENARLAELAGLHDLHRFQIGLFEMKPVGDHQLYVIFPSGVDHRLAFLFRDGHRLFAQNMDA